MPVKISVKARAGGDEQADGVGHCLGPPTECPKDRRDEAKGRDNLCEPLRRAGARRG